MTESDGVMLEAGVVEGSAEEEEDARLITQIDYSRSRTSDEGSSNDSDDMIQKKRQNKQQKKQRLILSLRKERSACLRKAKISAEYERFQQVSRVAIRSGESLRL